jgi:hypothetical protein
MYLFVTVIHLTTSVVLPMSSYFIRDPKRFVAELLKTTGTDSNKGAQMSSHTNRMPPRSDNQVVHPSAVECTPDLGGAHYLAFLDLLHTELRPKNYFEIGTLHGETLRIASCPSIAIDPSFVLNQDIIKSKSITAFYQMPSDEYFARFDPKTLFGGPIDFAFLDGMHRCEFLLRDFANTEAHCKRNSIIVLHDCIPVELPMTERMPGKDSVLAHRAGWWTGDVWRTVLALKEHRPDLAITALDAQPTGLILITNLDPTSDYIKMNYSLMVREMLRFDLSSITFERYYDKISLESTSNLECGEKLTARFWL